MNYNGGKFTVQTPWMDMPWQMSALTDDKYPTLITLSFRGMDDRPELQAFRQVAELKDKIIAVALPVPCLRRRRLLVVAIMFGRIVRVSMMLMEHPAGYPPSEA